LGAKGEHYNPKENITIPMIDRGDIAKIERLKENIANLLVVTS
jgi:hypothetical protein